MKESMSALDLKICVKEIENYLGAWANKIYEIDGTFLLKLNPANKSRTVLLIEPGRRMHLTEMKHETPRHPPSFAMLLRKHLSNSKFAKISQPDFERIIELEFSRKEEKRVLIAELFGDGNLILCDENREIIKPYKAKSWKHRDLKAGEKYELPPKKGKDITTISGEDLRKAISEEPDLVRGLARNLNIGGNLSEEICARAGLDKEKKPERLKEEDYRNLFEGIKGILSDETDPKIVKEGGKPSDVIPFPFKTVNDSESFESFESFNRALDHYFQKIDTEQTEREKSSEKEEKIESIKNRLDNQEKKLEELREKAEKTRKKADAISTHHEKIAAVLEKLEKLRNSGGWEEIEEEIQKGEGTSKELSKLIDSVEPSEGRIEISLPENTVNISVRKSSFENASDFYEKSKRAKDKIEGVKEAIQETKEKLVKIKEKGTEPAKKKTRPKPRKKRWYERFRWFRSSDEHLVIAGRDEKTNQEIVEKHMEPGDLYLHADIKGAPHTIIKANEKEITEDIIAEAAKFAATHSKAWRRGIASADVYWAKPEQVTKEAPSGEYIPKGGYMIKGDREYTTVSLEAGVGILKENDADIPVCGPPSAIETHSNLVIRIKPGATKKSDLAKRIKGKLQESTGSRVDLNELIRILPPGPGTMVS